MPAFFALSGTLVYQWFSDFDEPAAIAANFVVSSIVLIPLATVTSDFGRPENLSEQSAIAILLLLVGTLASSAAGRVFYEMALTATRNDNGYVTMFFLLIPALSALISFMLSHWIPGLQFVPRPMFFVGMALVTIPLLALSLASWRDSQPRGSNCGGSSDDIGLALRPLIGSYRDRIVSRMKIATTAAEASIDGFGVSQSNCVKGQTRFLSLGLSYRWRHSNRWLKHLPS